MRRGALVLALIGLAAVAAAQQPTFKSNTGAVVSIFATVMDKDNRLVPADIFSPIGGERQQGLRLAAFCPAGKQDTLAIEHQRRCVEGQSTPAQGRQIENWDEQRHSRQTAFTYDLALRGADLIEGDLYPDRCLVLAAEYQEGIVRKACIVNPQISNRG
jgi:hypothetical protein